LSGGAKSHQVRDGASIDEVKHDGYRLQVRREGDAVRLFTRRGFDWTARWTPFRAQDSSLLVPLVSADCLLIREPFAPAAEPGSPCVIVNLQF
jgi:hypothetical protein